MTKSSTAITEAPAFHWLRQIPSSLLQHDKVPLLGHPPAFPWDALQKELKALFELEALTMTPSIPAWRSKDQLFKGLSDKLLPIHFAISSLEGSFCWLMAEEDVRMLMALLITKNPEMPDFVDKDFEEGFIRFLSLEVIHAVGRINFDKTLSPHLLDTREMPHDETALTIDVEIAVAGKRVLGRLLLTSDFHDSWQQRYTPRNLDIPLTPSLAAKLDLTIHLEAGRTALTWKEWSNVGLGDFLILDTCSFPPDEDKGRVMLTIDGIPYFRGRLKDGVLKILENPLYHEVTMANEKNLSDEENETDFEESELEEDDLDEEETEEETEEEEEEEAEEEVKAPKPTVAPKAGPKAAPKAAPKKQEKPLSPKQIPLSIVVEVGRLQMSVQKIMELQPGNLLELDMRPENGVDLVVNGKRIGKGELLRVGEALGVRILDIG